MRKQVLIIDDDAAIRGFLCDGFQLAGYEVNTAADGNQGMQEFREHSADLVITDLLMPGKDGLEIIRELRKECPSVKIIAISGGHTAGLDFLQEARLFGALRTLAKPFTFEKILALSEEITNEC